MTGYSWVPISALFCYLFLLLTFLPSRKTDKVLRTFMMLMVTMILWVGGSYAMRTKMWPSVNFWHYVSVLGMLMVPPGYYYFVLDFLEERNNYNKQFWLISLIVLYIFNYITKLCIPEPVVIETAAGTQFIYSYTWHIYIMLGCGIACIVQNMLIIYRHCKGNRIAFQQLRPVLYGLLILVVGHVATTLPIFAGIPVDIFSGMLNAICVFYALYKKRLFKMTLLFSKTNYFAVSLIVCTALSLKFFSPLQQYLMRSFQLNHVTSAIIIGVIQVVVIWGLFTIITMVFNAIFIRNEKLQQARLRVFSEEITHTLSSLNILQNLTDTIQELTHLERILVFVRQVDGDFRVEHTTNLLEEKNFYLGADHPLLNCITENNNYINVVDFSRTTAYRSMWEKEKVLLRQLSAEYFVPMLHEGKLAGIILLPTRKDNAPYSTGDLAIVQAAAELCAPAMDDAIAYERAIDEARTDKLTGLANRKYFFELLEREFDRCKDTALSLCLLNIDNFKAYNQLYGTQEGDLALQRVAGLLRSSLNETSYAARIGGKEFAILLPGYDIHSAKLLTENIVSELGRNKGRANEQPSNRLTVSAGICAAPYMASSTKDLFQNAETAVYTVKRSGKNAVQIYSADIYPQQSHLGDLASGYDENASVIYALTSAIDAKDHYTFQHSENVAYYAKALAMEAGLSDKIINIVKEAALLHDIGKIAIPEDILNKPGKLTRDEYEVMKGHVDNSVNIIRHLPALDYVLPTVQAHHERYDGMGYPRKLKGEEIPITARILCIADSFDAMTSVRSYKDAMSKQQAIDILHEEAGHQFDPQLAMLFIGLVESERVEIFGSRGDNDRVPDVRFAGQT